TTDLHAAATQNRNYQTGNNRRNEPFFGRNSRRDGKRYGQRQCHDSNNNSRKYILSDLFFADAFLQQRKKFGCKLLTDHNLIDDVLRISREIATPKVLKFGTNGAGEVKISKFPSGRRKAMNAYFHL